MHLKYPHQFILGGNCNTGGFMLMCTAVVTSSPWHNFVSDTDHWLAGTNWIDGKSPCINNGGIYPVGTAFIATMRMNGALNIFTDTKDATFLGTPGCPDDCTSSSQGVCDTISKTCTCETGISGISCAGIDKQSKPF